MLVRNETLDDIVDAITERFISITRANRVTQWNDFSGVGFVRIGFLKPVSIHHPLIVRPDSSSSFSISLNGVFRQPRFLSHWNITHLLRFRGDRYSPSICYKQETTRQQHSSPFSFTRRIRSLYGLLFIWRGGCSERRLSSNSTISESMWYFVL